MTLYRPSSFQVRDPALVREFIEQHPFATVLSQREGEIVVSHVPVIVSRSTADQLTLAAHLAIRNPQVADLRSGSELLIIFQGPHAYITPLWYETPTAEVPTMSYIAVHAHGTPRVIEDREEIDAYFGQMMKIYEADQDPRWSTALLSQEFLDRMRREIVVFEMPVARIEEKFKLSQNRKQVDQARVREALAASSAPAENEVARWMERLQIGE